MSRLKQFLMDEVGGCHAQLYVPRLSYVASAEDADQRMARGQTQKFCRTCRRYRWKDEQRRCAMFVEGAKEEEPKS